MKTLVLVLLVVAILFSFYTSVQAQEGKGWQKNCRNWGQVHNTHCVAVFLGRTPTATPTEQLPTPSGDPYWGP